MHTKMYAAVGTEQSDYHSAWYIMLHRSRMRGLKTSHVGSEHCMPHNAVNDPWSCSNQTRIHATYLRGH